ncbi:hypothetical protein MD484_g5503, partial [Candolleomyces efflorescens]
MLEPSRKRFDSPLMQRLFANSPINQENASFADLSDHRDLFDSFYERMMESERIILRDGGYNGHLTSLREALQDSPAAVLSRSDAEVCRVATYAMNYGLVSQTCREPALRVRAFPTTPLADVLPTVTRTELSRIKAFFLGDGEDWLDLVKNFTQMVCQDGTIISNLSCNRGLICHSAAYKEILKNNNSLSRVATNLLAASHHVACLSQAKFLDKDLGMLPDLPKCALRGYKFVGELAPTGVDYQSFKVPALAGTLIDWVVLLSKKNMIRNQFSKRLILTAACRLSSEKPKALQKISRLIFGVLLQIAKKEINVFMGMARIAMGIDSSELRKLDEGETIYFRRLDQAVATSGAPAPSPLLPATPQPSSSTSQSAPSTPKPSPSTLLAPPASSTGQPPTHAPPPNLPAFIPSHLEPEALQRLREALAAAGTLLSILSAPTTRGNEHCLTNIMGIQDEGAPAAVPTSSALASPICSNTEGVLTAIPQFGYFTGCSATPTLDIEGSTSYGAVGSADFSGFPGGGNVDAFQYGSPRLSNHLGDGNADACGWTLDSATASALLAHMETEAGISENKEELFSFSSGSLCDEAIFWSNEAFSNLGNGMEFLAPADGMTTFAQPTHTAREGDLADFEMEEGPDHEYHDWFIDERLDPSVAMRQF